MELSKKGFNPLLPSRGKFILFAGPELIALLADDSSARSATIGSQRSGFAFGL
jgi:hypothetical protein